MSNCVAPYGELQRYTSDFSSCIIYEVRFCFPFLRELKVNNKTTVAFAIVKEGTIVGRHDLSSFCNIDLRNVSYKN